MLFNFEYIMKTAVDTATATDPQSGLTIHPDVQRKAGHLSVAKPTPRTSLTRYSPRVWLRWWTVPRAVQLLREKGTELPRMSSGSAGAGGDLAISKRV